MENKINYLQLILSFVMAVAGVLGGLWLAWTLFMKAEQNEAIDAKFKSLAYVTEAQLNNKVKEAVLDEREAQAEAKTASLSRGIADEMGWERSDVAPKAAKVFKFGYDQMEKHNEREMIWQEFTKTRFVGVIYKHNQIGVLTLYYRWITGDYLVQYEIVDGERKHYWKDENMLRHPLRELDKIKTIHLQ